MPASLRDLLCGIYQLEHRLLLRLDARRIADVAEVPRSGCAEVRHARGAERR